MAKDGASHGAESSSIGTISLKGPYTIHHISETQNMVLKEGNVWGEPLAGTDKSCIGDLRELQGTDAKNHSAQGSSSWEDQLMAGWL